MVLELANNWIFCTKAILQQHQKNKQSNRNIWFLQKKFSAQRETIQQYLQVNGPDFIYLFGKSKCLPMDHNGSVFCICRTNRCNCVSIFYGMLAGAKLLCHKKVHKNRCFYFLLATSLICCRATAGHQDLETECWPEQNVCATKRYTKIDVFRLGKVR